MIVDVDRLGEFRLPDDFVDDYRSRPVPWGFGALSWVTYRRTYSRDGERWHETCRRVIEGTFTVQRAHCLAHGRPWEEGKALALAREAYDRLWCFKWTPPGRGLWIMGTRFMYERGGAALNNCGFVSTAGIGSDFAAPFLWMLRMSMLGVGVGFDTRGRGRATVGRPATSPERHVIGDSREGWAEALGRLLGAYVGRGALPSAWDYSQVRPRGRRLESFGGQASGPVPLRHMLEGLDELYRSCEGRAADSRLLVDTMNIIGRCVVAGGIRRSAQIAIGDPDDTQFLDLKLDAEKVGEYRWVSNNSVFARRGMDYAGIAARTCRNGEPGYFWLENARARGRMEDPPDWADEEAQGSNPCVEQTLWDRELCCLVETYPAHHEDFEDYCRTLRMAYLYAKTVTLVPTGDPATNAVMERNRRIGCSMTGIVQAINRFGRERFLELCDKAYGYVRHLDDDYSQWLGVPRSIKTTSVKPSGTVSILAGATPGVHWDHAPYYIRRVRVRDDHPLVGMCSQAGYAVEPDQYADSTSVISFPVHVENAGRRKSEVPVREKVELAAQMQRVWSDNQVSCTADFDPDSEAADIPSLLSDYEGRLKAIVFLPSEAHGYAQPPYEEISRAEYERLAGAVRPLQGALEHEESLEARFCEGDVCEPL
jgi:adenosylcobalamin-dependent ribonucleoside-triphosphate reductase